jgi:tetratricopeptide (TPR) repeat protein
MKKGIMLTAAVVLSLAMPRGGVWAAELQTTQGQQNQQGQQNNQQGQSGQQNQQGQQGQQGQPGQPGQAGQPGQPAQPTGPRPQSQQEAQDFTALRNEAQAGLDADKIIQLGTAFDKKYPSSQLMTYSDMFVASAYQQKGDADKAIEYGDKSLKQKPDNLMSLIIVATLLPTPQSMKTGDKDKKLQEAEAHAKKALELIGQIPKQPNEADDAYNKRKTALGSDLHSALGMIHLQRAAEGLMGPDPAELGKAEQEYKAAVTGTDKPSPQDYYRLGETYLRQNKIDDAISAFTKASELGQGTGIEQYANAQLTELKKRKSQASAPAKQ